MIQMGIVKKVYLLVVIEVVNFEVLVNNKEFEYIGQKQEEDKVVVEQQREVWIDKHMLDKVKLLYIEEQKDKVA